MNNKEKIKQLESRIKDLDRLNKQLKDKVLFEKKHSLVDYSKLKPVENRMTGEEWIIGWHKTYGEEPKLT